jgi:hypothetical protein
MKAATQVVKTEMAELTGRPVETVFAAERREDGWHMTLEVVELERIPASTSVMGSYDVIADRDGHVLEYARTHRYYHNRADETDSP